MSFSLVFSLSARVVEIDMSPIGSFGVHTRYIYLVSNMTSVSVRLSVDCFSSPQYPSAQDPESTTTT